MTLTKPTPGKQLTFEQGHDFITAVIITKCADESCLDAQLGQGCCHIAGGASWVGRPGFNLLPGHTLVIVTGKEVCGGV
jgi:hypothetical protein